MFKLGFVGLLCAMAAASQAIVFSALSVGTYNNPGGTYTTSETVVSQITPSAVATMAFSGTYVGAGAAGTIIYTGAGGTITLAFATPGPFNLAGNTSSIDGTWTYQSGTGAYAGYTGGAGTFGAVYNTTGAYASTTLTGDLTPVPEPASMAVLGIGALAAISRRRRR
jgi:hypothetical protein